MNKMTQWIVAVLLLALLAIPVSAASFTPSVQQKGAPEVVLEPQEGETKVTGTVTVTPMAEAQKADEEVKAELEEAYKSIADAESLEKAAPVLAEAVKEMNSAVKVEALVVRDLFYVDVADVEGSVTLKFDMDLEKDDFVMVMRYVDGVWEIVDPELVVINEDGSVSVLFEDGVGTLAILVEGDE